MIEAAVYRMVPETTLIYLKSPAGQEVIRKIKMTEAFKKMEAEEKAKEQRGGSYEEK